MFNRKQIARHFYLNFGAISFILGLIFLISGLFNLGSLPLFYEAKSGSSGFDGTANLFVNAFLWVSFCLFLIITGFTFYSCGRDIPKIEQKEKELDTIDFFLLAIPFALGLALYLVLLLLTVVKPIQFFPNKLFVSDIMLLDLSIIFNAVLFFFALSIFHRIGEKFIKYGKKLGEIQ